MQHRRPLATDSLQVPQSATSSVRHISPQRSAKGVRGRPRKQPPPPPPPTPKEQLQALLRRRDVAIGLALFALFVLALIVSALQIASHSSEAVQYTPIPPQPPSPSVVTRQQHVGRAGAPDAPVPAAAPSSGNEINFDDVVTKVLAETWDLSREQPTEQEKGRSAAEKGGAPPRSYAELMKEMEELGLTVDDLTEGLNSAYRPEQ